jgi:hypothetical protein
MSGGKTSFDIRKYRSVRHVGGSRSDQTGGVIRAAGVVAWEPQQDFFWFQLDERFTVVPSELREVMVRAAVPVHQINRISRGTTCCIRPLNTGHISVLTLLISQRHFGRVTSNDPG